MQKLCLDKKDETLTKEKELVNVFSKILINIAKRFCVTIPNNVASENKIENNKITLKCVTWKPWNYYNYKMK